MDYGECKFVLWNKNTNTFSTGAFAAVGEFRLDLNCKATGDVWMMNLKIGSVKQCLCCSLAAKQHRRLCRISLKPDTNTLSRYFSVDHV